MSGLLALSSRTNRTGSLRSAHRYSSPPPVPFPGSLADLPHLFRHGEQSLKDLQGGRWKLLPQSRGEQVEPAPFGPRCHELRIDEGTVAWRIFYRTDPDAIVILDVLKKKTPATPKTVIEICKRRLAE